MIKKNHKVIKLLLITALVVMVAYFVASFLIARYIVSPTAKHIDIAPIFVNKDYQNVSFKTSDDLKLQGWLFNPNAQRFVVFVPGFLDNRTNGGYYGVDLTRELIAKKFGVLLYDPRSRGNSEGSMRLKNENLDVVAAVNFLKSRAIDKKDVYILSYSTGSRATLLALPDIQGIGGIVIDSTPTNFNSVLDYIVTQEQHIPALILPGVHLFLNTYGITMGEDEILKNVANSTVPLLILHAKNDQSVPLTNSTQILNSNKNSKLVIFPTGSHIETYKYNPDLFRGTLFKFLSK